jgi:hypothetical protein
MVRLLSRQHGRNRPLHLQGAVKTAVAQDWGRTIVAIAPANELWIRAFFRAGTKLRPCLRGGRSARLVRGRGNISEKSGASMMCPRRA